MRPPAITLTSSLATLEHVDGCRTVGSGPELEDPVVAVAGTAPTVAVAGGEPKRAVRCSNNCPQTPVLPDKQRRRSAQRAVGPDRYLEESLTAKGRDP
jgi:hypothetical protein